MAEIETDKPKKRKRKNSERRTRWLFGMMAVLLLVVLPAGLLVYVTVQPAPVPTPPLYPMPTATPVLTLAYHCHVADNAYQVVIYHDAAGQSFISPDNQHKIEYRESGVYLSKNSPGSAAILLSAETLNFYHQTVYWSPDSQSLVLLDMQQQVILVTLNGNQRVLLEYGRDMLGWSPDSRHFLVNDGEYIWLLPIDGAARQLLKFDPLAYYIQNWSPNGEYLLMIGNDSADYTLKRVTILPVDPQQPTVINDVRVFNQYVEWSPDGKNVIIFAQADDGQQVVHFAALDGSVSYDYGIPDGMTPASTPVIWSTHRRTIALYLRPETEEKPQSIMLIGLDGTVLPVATIPQDELVQLRYQSPLEPNMTALHWSADDTQFRYWADNTLYAFDTRTHTTQTLYAPPEANFDMQTVYYVPNVNRLLVYTQQTNHTWAEVLSLSGEVLARFDLPSLNFNNLMPHDWLISSSRVVVPLIDVNARNWHIINLQALWTKPLLPPNVADMGEPSWSPQSNFVAITWSDMLALPEQFNPKRRVYLTWMNTNTGDMMTLDDAFYSVYDVVWAADEQYLIYTAWRESGTTIEKLNLQTGETQPIIEGENAHHIQWDAVQQRLTLWREVGSQFPAMQLDIEHRPLPTTPTPSAGDWQYEGYTLAGEKVFAFLLPNAKPDWSRIFPAPDGSVVIAKTIGGGFDSQALHVLDLATNSTSIVTQDLKGLGDPVWSPDGNLIMYTQWTQDRMLSINLIDRTSRPIWSQPLETLHVFDWQQCE